MTLLAELDRERRAERERLRFRVRQKLQSALREMLPSQAVYVFGSITREGQFHARSDVDLGILELPDGVSEFGLQAALEDRIGCPVDLCIVWDHRLKEKIQRGGETWTV
jgi:predicted nucleotidyltransferase